MEDLGVFLFVCFGQFDHGMWDLSSLTRDQIHAPCLESRDGVLTNGPPGKSQALGFFNSQVI